jgi:hypothetical protein
MPTLVISDLHLGSPSRSDLLRVPALREPLLELAAGAERVVLLGDLLELRQGPPREALAAARSFTEELGRALGDSELVLVAGNHDHLMIEPWLALRGEREDPGPLGLEQLIEPRDASPIAQRLSEWAAPARTLVAYPGLWLRRDVYATHGHYLDCHLTVPTLERLGVAAMSRLLARPASAFAAVEDYESVTAPVYAWRAAVSRELPVGGLLDGQTTLRAWQALGGAGGHRRRDGARGGRRGGSLAAMLRRRALVGAFPLAVAALNRAGLGPLRAEISAAELRRAGLRAMGEVAARLGLRQGHVIFGHTHRSGPLAGDDLSEWRAGRDDDGAGAVQLVNCGCWTYDSLFLTAKPGESPYWPGVCVVVEESGPPRLRLLLADHSHAELDPRRKAAPV